MPMPLHNYACHLPVSSLLFSQFHLLVVSFAGSAWFGRRVEDYLCFLVTLWVDKSVAVARFSIYIMHKPMHDG